MPETTEQTPVEARSFLDGAPAATSNLPAHRPSSFTQEKAEKFCDLIADGMSLKQACAVIECGKSTIFRWVGANPEFLTQYNAAMLWRTDNLADEILGIADDASEDYKDEQHGDNMPVRVVDKETLGRSTLKIEARKWLLAKLLPQRYGDLRLPPPGTTPNPGDNAKLVNSPAGGPYLLENEPLAEVLAAFSRSKPPALAKP